MSKSYLRNWTVYGKNTTVNVPGSTVVSQKSQAFSMSTTVSGGLNPWYRQAIARGASATTTLVVDAQDLHVHPGFVFAQVSSSPGFKTTWTADGTFPFTPVPSFVSPVFNSIAEARAVASLYRQIRGLHNQFQGGVFLGELKQTVELIMNPIRGITKATTNYLSKGKKLAASARKANNRKSLRENLSNEYLKWTFGVIPLMNDISDISKTIQRAVSDPPRTRFTASGEFTSGTTSVLAPIAVLGSVYCTRNEVQETRSFVKYYGAFKAMSNEELVKPRLERIRELSGFTLRDFIPTVWNLIPYSFVADYFVNIGDVLEALTTDTSGVMWLARTQVVIKKHVHNVVPSFSHSKSVAPSSWIWYAFSGASGGYTALRTTINRASAVIPIMEFRSKIQFGMGKKVLNLLALIAAKM